MNTENLNDTVHQMSDDALIMLQNKIERIMEARDEALMEKKMTREELMKLYAGFGYIVNNGDRFWKIQASGKGKGLYGWEVGHYTHSCHVDSTEIFVLLVIEPSSGGSKYVVDYADLWLEGPIIV